MATVTMAMDRSIITTTIITITHIHTHHPKSTQVHRHRHRLHRLARIRRLTVLLIAQIKAKRVQVRRATEIQKAATIGVPAISGRAVAAMGVVRLAAEAAEAVEAVEEPQARPSPRDRELLLASPGTEALATEEAIAREVVGPAMDPLDTDRPPMELLMGPLTALHTEALTGLRMDQRTAPRTAQAMGHTDRIVMVVTRQLSIHRLLLRRDPHLHRLLILPRLRLLHQRPSHRSPDPLLRIHHRPCPHRPKRHKQDRPPTIAELASRRTRTWE